jgi:hypothetical protein
MVHGEHSSFRRNYSSTSSLKKLFKDNLFSFISFLDEEKNSKKGSNLGPLDCKGGF